MSKTSSNPLTEGVRFQFQGSGKCCISHGEYGYVYLSLEDRKRLARSLRLKTSDFTKRYCKRQEGFWILRDDPKSPDCVFLKEKTKCSVYQARPTQCRTWPFWPDVMPAKRWRQDVVKFCPGVGKGRYYSPVEVAAILNEQSANERAMLRDLK